MFRHQLLGLLRDGNAYHGYALVKEFVRRTGVDTNTGYAYRDLQKLVEDGLVEVVENAKGADRRRRPYQITEAGRVCFDEWFSDLPHVTLGPDGELAARAIFFDEVDSDVAGLVLERWRQDLDLLCKKIQQQIDFPRTKGGNARALEMIQRRRKRLVEAELSFLDELQSSTKEPEADTTEERAERRSENQDSVASTLGAARLSVARAFRT